MNRTLKTEIITLTDASGSMQVIKAATIAGYNRFLDEQKQMEGEARVTSIQFNNDYKQVFQGRPIAQVRGLDSVSYMPTGGTALYDALGRMLNEQGARIKSEAWAELVVVAILTDGEENSSREFTREQVAKMTGHAEEHGWKFVYLAANQDAMKAARNVGLKHAFAQTFAYDAVGTQTAYASTSAAVGSLRSGVSMSDFAKTL